MSLINQLRQFSKLAPKLTDVIFKGATRDTTYCTTKNCTERTVIDSDEAKTMFSLSLVVKGYQSLD